MKAKLQSKHMLGAIAVLLVAVAALAWLNARGAALPGDRLSITSEGEVLAEFSLEQIRSLPAVEVEKTIHSGSSADEHGTYTGAELSALLRAAGISLSGEYQRFIAKAGDGFAAEFSLDEVLQPDNILVVYAQDGEALLSQEEGGVGPLRILAVGDSFGNRCTKYLNEIEVE